MRDKCPGCGAVHDYIPDEQARFTCYECGCVLVAGQEGLRRAPGPAKVKAETAPPQTAPAARPSRPRSESDLGTILLAVGTCLVILFRFMPLLDMTRISGRKTAIVLGDLRQQRLDQEVELKYRQDLSEPPQKPDEQKREEERKRREEDYKGRRDARKEWEKEKLSLQMRVDEAEGLASRMSFWYVAGMLGGFLMVALGAISYLRPTQTTTRRVVGGIILCALVLLIFLAIAGGSLDLLRWARMQS